MNYDLGMVVLCGLNRNHMRRDAIDNSDFLIVLNANCKLTLNSALLQLKQKQKLVLLNAIVISTAGHINMYKL